MSHSKQVNRTIDLSIHDVYRVVSGETFLLTDEGMVEPTESQICLLYTSDAADE